MREHYDFSEAIKNPHAKRLKKGYTFVIEHENYDEIIKVEKSIKVRNSNDSKVEPVKKVSAKNQ